jgi:hypothetical protein
VYREPPLCRRVKKSKGRLKKVAKNPAMPELVTTTLRLDKLVRFFSCVLDSEKNANWLQVDSGCADDGVLSRSSSAIDPYQRVHYINNCPALFSGGFRSSDCKRITKGNFSGTHPSAQIGGLISSFTAT